MTVPDPKLIRPVSDRKILCLVAAYALVMVAFGVALSAPGELLEGLVRILTVRDALLTDYFGIGGVSASFVNAGLLGLIACAFTWWTKTRLSGAMVAALFLLMGFGLFGKNLLNIWLIPLGVTIHARWRRQPLSAHGHEAIFACAMAPVFTEILYSTTLTPLLRAPLAITTSVLLGFIVPAAAAQLFRAHMGFCLYNFGFAAGVVGSVTVALLKSYGFVPDPVMVWTSGPRTLLVLFLLALLASMFLVGLLLDREALTRQRWILNSSGQAPTDFITTAGFGPTLMNMGICGLIGLTYLLLVRADLNGPTIGGVLTLTGFGAFGKHPRNILPILVGVFLGSLAKPASAADPGFVLAALFGTNLAPIAGAFGPAWGVTAGFIHSSAAQSVGVIHAGLNLYNNGFAAGMVAAVLLPVIRLIRFDSGSGKAP